MVRKESQSQFKQHPALAGKRWKNWQNVSYLASSGMNARYQMEINNITTPLRQAGMLNLAEMRSSVSMTLKRGNVVKHIRALVVSDVPQRTHTHTQKT
ncbi:hypothetical protein CEXT_702581 [Caerostris extrusa]|uniref:Uncharacterized protein n=1 Tax=Caerostris extrusa TaxID=172846 RepID=A0AAV4XN89_CAEEX|nr:hypothetical protein CEXT_702581 [Caerostris extrusa]